jgi:cobalt-zinc-cadmium efflux system membrane fusion protein
MQHKKFSSILIFIIAVLFIFSCGHRGPTEQPAEKRFCIPDSLLKNVTFDTIHTAPNNSILSFSGKITFNEDRVSRIYPLVSGHVKEVKVSLGDFVEKGKTLAVIESSDMANYYNEYNSSQAELTIARKNLEVTGNMRSSGVSSEKDYLIAQNDYQKALSENKRISEVLKIYGSTFAPNDSTGSGYIIKAPISGFVVDKNVTAGMDLRADANDNLFTISDLKELWAIANVYETDISKIRVGSNAEVVTLSYPDKKYKGKVDRISNVLDPDTKVMSIKIRLDNKDFTLKPGMYAHISLLLPGDKKMLTLKSNSIIFDDSYTYVLRFNGKCKVSIQKINIFKSVNDLNFVECDSLHDGNLLVSRNGLYIFTALKGL